MEREHVFIDFVPLVVLFEDHGEDGLIWAKHDVNDAMHVREDPLLVKLLRNFVPIGEVSAAMLVLRTVRILSEIF